MCTYNDANTRFYQLAIFIRPLTLYSPPKLGQESDSTMEAREAVDMCSEATSQQDATDTASASSDPLLTQRAGRQAASPQQPQPPKQPAVTPAQAPAAAVATAAEPAGLTKAQRRAEKQAAQAASAAANGNGAGAEQQSAAQDQARGNGAVPSPAEAATPEV